MTTTMTRERPVRPTPAPQPMTSAPRPVIATRAELAECTCPELCERDHSDE